MWAATMALNGMLSAGVPTDWASHMIGRKLLHYTESTTPVPLSLCLHYGACAKGKKQLTGMMTC
jgi:alcohol dehydrogenase YqhD (iron-dependent ADH family)